MTEQAMMLIMHSGSARSFAMEAISEAKENKFEDAHNLIKECEKEVVSAHKIQTELIQSEARGDKHELTLLMVHAQDHLMTTLVVKDMAQEFIELYEKLV